jgi:hypothetical protein
LNATSFTLTDEQDLQLTTQFGSSSTRVAETPPTTALDTWVNEAMGIRQLAPAIILPPAGAASTDWLPLQTEDLIELFVIGALSERNQSESQVKFNAQFRHQIQDSAEEMPIPVFGSAPHDWVPLKSWFAKNGAIALGLGVVAEKPVLVLLEFGVVSVVYMIRPLEDVLRETLASRVNEKLSGQSAKE